MIHHKGNLNILHHNHGMEELRSRQNKSSSYSPIHLIQLAVLYSSILLCNQSLGRSVNYHLRSPCQAMFALSELQLGLGYVKAALSKYW